MKSTKRYKHKEQAVSTRPVFFMLKKRGRFFQVQALWFSCLHIGVHCRFVGLRFHVENNSPAFQVQALWFSYLHIVAS